MRAGSWGDLPPPFPAPLAAPQGSPARGCAGRGHEEGRGSGAPGVTCPRGEESPRSGSGPEDAVWPVPAGGTYRCGAAPAPGAPGRPPAPSTGDSAPSGLRETPPARTPQNSGGVPRQHPRRPRPRLSPALSTRPWHLSFRARGPQQPWAGTLRSRWDWGRGGRGGGWGGSKPAPVPPPDM